MKRIILFFFALSALLCNAQDLCKIVYLNTPDIVIGGKTLRVGDSFEAEAKINWDENKKQVMKFCYNNCTKQRVVSSDAFKQNKSGSVSDYLFSRGQLSSRAGALNSVRELKQYFGRTLGLINELRVNIGSTFLMDENCYFYVSYRYNDENINKKLTSEASQLILNTSVYSIDGNPIPLQSMQMSLYYYNSEKKTQALITDEMTIFPIESTTLLHWIKELNAPELTTADKIEILSEYLDIKYPEVYFPATDLEKWITSAK